MDMDGVLWHGDTPMPGLVAYFALREPRASTMCSPPTTPPRRPLNTCRSWPASVSTCPADRILTSAEATATYLADTYAPGTAVYVVGDGGLHEAIAARGFIG